MDLAVRTPKVSNDTLDGLCLSKLRKHDSSNTWAEPLHTSPRHCSVLPSDLNEGAWLSAELQQFIFEHSYHWRPRRHQGYSSICPEKQLRNSAWFPPPKSTSISRMSRDSRMHGYINLARRRCSCLLQHTLRFLFAKIGIWASNDRCLFLRKSYRKL